MYIYIYTSKRKKHETAVILYIIYYFEDDALFSIYVAPIHLNQCASIDVYGCACPEMASPGIAAVFFIPPRSHWDQPPS